MEIQSLGYATDIAILELGGSRIEDRGDHLVVRSPANPLHWWGNFILLGTMPTSDQQSEWINVFCDAFPNATHVAIGIDDGQADVTRLAGFVADGMEVEHLVVMTAPHIAASLTKAAGVEWRTLVSDDDWAQSVELRVACGDRGLDPAGYREFAEAKSGSNRSLVVAGHGAWFGAFLDGHLISQMGLVQVGDGRARFQSVETHPDHRRRGLARALLLEAAHFGFDTFEARELVILADPDSWAIDLYRSVGFTPVEVRCAVERPMRAIEER